MAVACPKCGTRFKLPPSPAIGPAGRKVRCARCHHVWHQKPVADAPTPRRKEAFPPPPPPPGPAGGADDTVNTAMAFDAFADDAANPWDELTDDGDPIPEMDDRAEPVWKKPAFQWAALGAAMILVLAGLTLGRQAVVALWPPSVMIYDFVGLPIEVLGEGLAFENVRSSFEREGEFHLILVAGEIRNATPLLKPVPPVRVTALSADGRPLDVWVVPAEPVNLMPNEVARFETRQSDPGETAEVEVTFDPGNG